MSSSDTQGYIDRLRNAGLRATGPRVAILSALAADRRHPSAEMIYESVRTTHPSVSLSTVYSTLENLIQRGLIRKVGSHHGRLRVDGTAHDHDHAICRICDHVFDVDCEHFERPAPPTNLPEGLEVTKMYIEYEVVCADCRDQS